MPVKDTIDIETAHKSYIYGNREIVKGQQNDMGLIIHICTKTTLFAVGDMHSNRLG